MNNIYGSVNIVRQAYDEIETKQLSNDIPHMDQMLLQSDLTYAFQDKVPDISQKIESELFYLRARSHISGYKDLRSNRKIIGKIIVFIKKRIRSMLSFYIEPITGSVSDYNNHVIYALELMKKSLLEKDMQIKELTEKIDH